MFLMMACNSLFFIASPTNALTPDGFKAMGLIDLRKVGFSVRFQLRIWSAVEFLSTYH